MPERADWRRTAVLAFLLCSLAGPIAAKQLSFHRDGPNLSYRWQPPSQVAEGKIQSFTLTLPLTPAGHLRAFTAWKPEAAKQLLFTRLLAAARAQWPDAVFIPQRQDDWYIDIQIRDQKKLAEVQQWLAKEQTNQYAKLLKEAYQKQATDPDGHSGIRPDHVRIIDEASTELGDLAEHLLQNAGGETTNPRQLLAYLLAFVQSIPYDNRAAKWLNPQSTFRLPRQVLESNGGDCGSKVALLAGLWRYLQPEIPQMLVYIPGHMLMGVALPAMPGEETLQVNGFNWLLIEPTGPAELPLGHIGDESRLAVRTGHQVTELVQPTETNSTPTR